MDGHKTPLKGVLVILQTLERREREVCRSLTDAQGYACQTQLTSGVYRVIAATPYGTWSARVQEFLVTEAKTRLTVQLSPRPQGIAATEADDGGDDAEVAAQAPNAGADGVRVLDVSGAPLKDALVVIKTLDGKEELCRSLSDAEGYVCQMEVIRSPCRAIATTPYGLWKTGVLESLGREGPARLQFMLRPRATHGYGDIVSVGNQEADVLVRRQSGEPVAGANVLVRDGYATLYLERWYRTDSAGKVRIELVGQPTVVVVVSDGILLSQEVVGDARSIVITLPARSRSTATP